MTHQRDPAPSARVLRLLDAAGRSPGDVVLQLLTVDLTPCLARLPDLDATAWQALRSQLPELVRTLGPVVYADAVPAQQRILHQLVQAGDRAAADAFVRGGGLRLAGRRVDAEGRLDYSDLADLVAGVPEQAFVLSTAQTPLRSRIRRVRLEGEDLVITGWAHVAHVSAGSQQVTATLVAGNGRELPLVSSQHDDDTVEEDVPPGGTRCDVRRSGLTVTVPLAHVPTGRWTVRLEIRVGDIVRTGTWVRPVGAGAAGRRRSLWAGPGRTAVVDEDDERRLRIVIQRARHTASAAYVDDTDTLVLTGPGGAPAELVLVRTADRAEARPETVSVPNGWEARIPMPAVLPDADEMCQWTVWAVDEGDRVPVRHAARNHPSDADPRVHAMTDDRGRMLLRVRAVAGSVLDARVDDDGVEIDLRVLGADPARLSMRLDPTPWAGVSPVGVLRQLGRGAVAVRFDLRQPRWGSVGVLPSGRYRLDVRDATTGRSVSVAVAARLIDRLPLDVTVSDVRVQVRTGRAGLGLGLRLLPPLAPEERGPANIARLQALAHAGSAREPAVLFRTLFGEATNDSALALHHELRRRGSPLGLYWSVRDRSVPVPEGGIGLIEGSREWYRMLGEAAYLVLNQHEPRWYHKVPGQVMVQTFHGYPYKLMGRPWWDLKDTPADLIASNYRVSRDWDHLVSPSAYATPLLLAAFFDDEGRRHVDVVEAGYPRNDVLLADDAPEVRRRTRAALGVGEDQIVVLYAPTFRDYLRLDETRARAADLFDPGAVAATLGPRYVVLVRGHAYHARAQAGQNPVPGVLDVTHYADVAELCLASDAAVLDYSSLRFDYALLRRPMVFLVPDAATYHEARPGLVDFAATAPGPHVRTTAEVIEELRDLSGLRTRFAGAVEEFVEAFMEREDGHSAARVVDAIFGESRRSGPLGRLGA